MSASFYVWWNFAPPSMLHFPFADFLFVWKNRLFPKRGHPPMYVFITSLAILSSIDKSSRWEYDIVFYQIVLWSLVSRESSLQRTLPLCRSPSSRDSPKFVDQISDLSSARRRDQWTISSQSTTSSRFLFSYFESHTSIRYQSRISRCLSTSSSSNSLYHTRKSNRTSWSKHSTRTESYKISWLSLE